MSVPDPPPVGTIVKSHIEYDYERVTYPKGSFFRLVNVGTFHPQGNTWGYWAIKVQSIETHVKIQTYDDYFKIDHKQSNRMDVASRPCLFP